MSRRPIAVLVQDQYPETTGAHTAMQIGRKKSSDVHLHSRRYRQRSNLAQVEQEMRRASAKGRSSGFSALGFRPPEQNMQETHCFRDACCGKAYPNHDKGNRIIPCEPSEFPGTLE